MYHPFKFIWIFKNIIDPPYFVIQIVHGKVMGLRCRNPEITWIPFPIIILLYFGLFFFFFLLTFHLYFLVISTILLGKQCYTSWYVVNSNMLQYCIIFTLSAMGQNICKYKNIKTSGNMGSITAYNVTNLKFIMLNYLPITKDTAV